jgi:hypothetical protein
MQIEIEKETSKKIDRAAKVLGIRKNELVDRAIVVYLDNLSQYIKLKKELKSWESLSDEALTVFEKSYNEKR